MPTLALPKNNIMQAATKAALATFAALLLIPIAIGMLLFTTTGCKDDEPIKPIIIGPSDDLDKTLPPITTTGAGTFGCLVDGEPWVARTNLLWTTLNASVGPGWVSGQNLRVFAIRKKIGENFSSVNMELYNLPIINAPDTLLLKFKDLSEGAATFYTQHPDSFDSENNEYWLDTNVIGKLIILKLDTYVISGTFEYEAYNKHYDKRVKITNGRFDIHYRN